VITETQHNKIDYIIDHFNFERVLLAMTALDWRWQATEGNGLAIPTLPKLKAVARHLLKESIKNKCVGTGGLQAEYFASANNQEEEEFVLMFILTQTNSEFYD
jgi:hypothetical protein